MDLFSAVGFNWNRLKTPDVMPTHSIERVTFRFHQMLSVFVWDASVLEGNPFTILKLKLCWMASLSAEEKFLIKSRFSTLL
jgi:hypothetical protein